MKPLQWLSERLAKTTTIARMIPMWKVGHRLPGPRDFDRFAREGYTRNTIIYACIDELATSLAESPLVAEHKVSKDEWEPDEALQDTLDNPNPEQSQEEWLREWMLHYGWTGNVFMHVDRSPVGRVAEMWFLKASRIDIVPGPDGKVAHYIHEVEGNKSPPLPARDMVHDKNLNPLDDYWGLSPIEVLAWAGHLDNESVKYLADFFANGGQPSQILKLKGIVEKSERERVKRVWKDEYGTDGFHGIAVIDADAEVQELGSRPDQLGLAGIFDTTESRICMTFGVHPMIIATRLGLFRSTMANYEQAEKAFQLRTMEQHRRRIEARLTKFFQTETGNKNIRVRFDRDKVPALQQDMEPEREFAIASYKEGLATLNEARAIAGFEPWDGPEGDEFKPSPAPPGMDDEEGEGEENPQDESNNGSNERRNTNGRVNRKDVFTAAEWYAIGMDENKANGSLAVAERTNTEAEINYAVGIDSIARQFEPQFKAEAEIQFGKERLSVRKALRDELSLLAAEDDVTRLVTIISRALATQQRVWAGAMLPLYSQLLEAQGEIISGQLGINFDVNNPAIKEFLDHYTFKFAERLGKTTESRLRRIITEGVTEGKSIPAIRNAINDAYKQFTPERAEMIARTETIRASNKGALESFRVAGIQRLRWLSSGDERTCPFCQSLNGREFGTGEVILEVGGSLTLEDGQSLTNTYEDVDTPPVHVDCRCTIITVN